MLPRAISLQTLNAIEDNFAYETHRSTIAAHNNLLQSLGPGDPIAPKHFTLSGGLGNTALVSAVSGTYKRGRFTVTVQGSGIGTDPTIKLNYPMGMWDSAPFVVVTLNGGTFAYAFSWTESTQALIVTISGVPAAGVTFCFQFAARE